MYYSRIRDPDRFMAPRLCPTIYIWFLWSGEQWLCIACQEHSLPGKDSLSKSMNKMIEYAEHTRRDLLSKPKGSRPKDLAAELNGRGG